MAIALPVLLKLETDQLAFKKSFEFFNYTFSPFEIFVIIL
jgi:hypothetical protein